MRRLGPMAVVVAGCAALLARPWLVRLPGDPVVLLVALFAVLGLVGAFWPLPAPASGTTTAALDDGPSRRLPCPAPDGTPERPAASASRAAALGTLERPADRTATTRRGLARPSERPAAERRGLAPPSERPAAERRGLARFSGWSSATPPASERQASERRPVPAWVALGVGLGAFGAGRLLAVGAVPVAPFVLRSVALNSLAAVSEEAFFRRFAYGLAEARGPAVAIGTSAAIFAAVHVTVWGWAVLPLDLAAGLVLGWQRWASAGWSVPAATHVAANVLAVW